MTSISEAEQDVKDTLTSFLITPENDNVYDVGSYDKKYENIADLGLTHASQARRLLEFYGKELLFVKERDGTHVPYLIDKASGVWKIGVEASNSTSRPPNSEFAFARRAGQR